MDIKDSKDSYFISIPKPDFITKKYCEVVCDKELFTSCFVSSMGKTFEKYININEDLMYESKLNISFNKNVIHGVCFTFEEKNVRFSIGKPNKFEQNDICKFLNFIVSLGYDLEIDNDLKAVCIVSRSRMRKYCMHESSPLCECLTRLGLTKIWFNYIQCF